MYTTFFLVDAFVAHVKFFVAGFVARYFFFWSFRGPLSGLFVGRFVAFREPLQEKFRSVHFCVRGYMGGSYIMATCLSCDARGA